MIENRDIRQRDILPPEELKNTEVTVIGVGAIGRQVSLQLAAIGVGKLKLIDPDIVGPENLSAQGFMEKDIGSDKVTAVKTLCEQINSEIEISTVKRKFGSMDFKTGVVFCCVDSIDARKSIFEKVSSSCHLFVDGRMSAEFMRVLTVHDDKSGEYYQTQLFPSEEAFQGSCTAKSTIYCANMAAAVMVAQFSKWLRQLPILDSNIELNLLANEMVATS